MDYLIYISSAKWLLSHQELLQILKESRDRNIDYGITGMLLYMDGNFMQLLEGDTESVDDIYEMIYRDPRHHNLIKVVQAPLEQRNFPDWTMGFKHINKEDVLQYDASFKIDEHTFKSSKYVDNPHIALELLSSFYEEWT